MFKAKQSTANFLHNQYQHLVARICKSYPPHIEVQYILICIMFIPNSIQNHISFNLLVDSSTSVFCNHTNHRMFNTRMSVWDQSLMFCSHTNHRMFNTRMGPISDVICSGLIYQGIMHMTE